MAYIRFAREEKELFKLLFMCDRSNEKPEDDRESIRPLLALLQKNLGLSEDEAFISKVLTDTYEGIKRSYTGGKR